MSNLKGNLQSISLTDVLQLLHVNKKAGLLQVHGEKVNGVMYINNGEVVSGNMGSSVKMDFTVLGGNVNLAARLGLVAAQGGQTIISHAVYSLVADRFKIDKLAPVQLKGIKEPVPLYWPRQEIKKGGA